MGTFFYLFFKSLETGSVYALAALAIVLIFRTSNTTNFAQGSIGTLNAFVAAKLLLSWDLSIWVVAIISMFTAFITGILIDTFVIRLVSKVSPVAKQIITLGLIMVIIGLIPMLFGVDQMRISRFILVTPETTINLLGTTISYNAIFIIVLSFAIMGFLFWFLKYTKWGLAIRVTASNEITSKLMGVPTKTVTMASWATAAALGTLAALIVAPQSSVNVGMMTDVQVNAFFACVLGGFATFHGPVIGAYIIAFSKSITQYYVSDEWGYVIVYIIILVFLFFKPFGIFGKKKISKV